MTLSTKSLHMTAKNGVTTAEAMAKFGFSSKEDFFKAIERICPSQLRSFKKQFAQNDKKSRNVSVKEGIKQNVLENPIQEEDKQLNQEGAQEEPTQEEERMLNQEEVQKEPAQEVKVEMSIETLKQKERELSSKSIELEKVRNGYVQQRGQIRDQLSNTLRTLKELKRLVQENLKNVANLNANYDNLAEQMAKVLEELEPVKESLQDIRTQIEELERINIYIYEDGNIEAENAERKIPLPDVDSSAVNENLQKLISHPMAENFKLRELKALAVLKIYVSLIRGGYNITFDNESLREFWEELQ